ncbi:MAG: sugar transferase [Bacteroidetes bacterium]|nr:MAG: sugar transferase [Bacteroidota bacterium]
MVDRELAPVAVFAYNRLDHLKQTIESLQENKLSGLCALYIFSDGAKNTSEKDVIAKLRSYMAEIKGFKRVRIIERDVNLGLAKSIIAGVSQLIDKYGRVIVLEDDLVVSNDFLEYMNDALDYYKDDKNIFSISGYAGAIDIPENYEKPVFLFQRINSWGWASWKDRWDTVDWQMSYFPSFIKNKQLRKSFNRIGPDLAVMLLKQYQKKINSWAIRFNYACFTQNKYNVYPVGAKVVNKGADGSGTNIRKTSRYVSKLNTDKIVFPINLTENKIISKNYIRFLKPSVLRQIINYFKIQLYLLNQKKR